MDPNESIRPGVVTVSVFAGGPVEGAAVELVAADSQTGEPLTNRPDKGVVGVGGPTNELGTATIELKGVVNGLVQVRARGGHYQDPSSPATKVTIPDDGVLSSFVGGYRHGTNVSTAVSLWTTLADSAAVAYAKGKNVESPTEQRVSAALVVTDVLFVQHVDRNGVWSVRDVAPVPLAQGRQTMRDAVRAALPDVALNQLARDSASGATAFALMQDLLSDLSFDGQFDGQGVQGQLKRGDLVLSAETTRGVLAKALDRFARSTNNTSELNRAALQGAGVYDAMAQDASLLYPRDAVPPKVELDARPGTVTVRVNAGTPVANAQVRVVALDSSTGEALTSREDKGVLGSGVTTSEGLVEVKVGAVHDGLVQVVAEGGEYQDPTQQGMKSLSRTTALPLSSTIQYSNGASYSVPVTLWTTLVDRAAVAVAAGRNSQMPGAQHLAERLPEVEKLLARHLAPQAIDWNVRTTNPARELASPPTAEAIALLSNVSLCQLARDLATKTSTEVTPDKVLADLVTDVGADGLLDGLASGARLTIGTKEVYQYSADTTRRDLAYAVDRFVQGPANTSGVRRLQIEHAGIYEAIATDTCGLYPTGSPPGPFVLERVPPAIDAMEVPAWTNQPTVQVTLKVTDSSGTGIKAVYVQLNSEAPVQAEPMHALWVVRELKLRIGGNTVQAWAEDHAGNSGKGMVGTSYHATRETGFDATPKRTEALPTGSFYSEEGLALQSDVPPAQYAKGALTAVQPGTPIVKAASRTSWGPTRPTWTMLAGDNPNNTPWLELQAPVKGTEAPVRSIKCRLHTAQSSGAESQALEATDRHTYVLPIARENLFPQGSEETEFRFTVECVAEDAAGNVGTSTLPGSGEYVYRIVAAPLFITRDPYYKNEIHDPRNLFAGSLSRGTYHTIWNGSPRRFARWVVANPSDVPIRIRGMARLNSETGTYWLGSVTETFWEGNKQLFPDSAPIQWVTLNGRSYRSSYWWSSWQQGTPPQDCVVGGNMRDKAPCPSPRRIAVEPGDPQEWWCDTLGHLPSIEAGTTFEDRGRIESTTPNGSRAPRYRVYKWLVDPAAEGEGAEDLIVPAAAGGAPGRVSLYLEGAIDRAVTTRDLGEWKQAGAYVNTWWPQSLFASATSPGAYMSWRRDSWRPVAMGMGEMCSNIPVILSDRYNLNREYRRLDKASLLFDADLTVETKPELGSLSSTWQPSLNLEIKGEKHDFP